MIRAPIILACAVFLFGCDKKRTPSQYLIPSDYEGVVITIFNQPGFPGLPLVDGFRVHEYPDDGILITSSEQEFGWASDEVLDVFEDGTRRRLPVCHSGGRCERFSATGTHLDVSATEIVFYYKAVGSDEYWEGRDAREYDRKREEAVSKIARTKQGNSKEGGTG
ncbi:MAG: DUF6843 domain-containing protein [Opitutales bacterium]